MIMVCLPAAQGFHKSSIFKICSGLQVKTPRFPRNPSQTGYLPTIMDKLQRFGKGFKQCWECKADRKKGTRKPSVQSISHFQLVVSSAVLA